jgi:transposase
MYFIRAYSETCAEIVLTLKPTDVRDIRQDLDGYPAKCVETDRECDRPKPGRACHRRASNGGLLTVLHLPIPHALPDSHLDVGGKSNQKLHQWSFGSIRHKLTYKAERRGMMVVLQEERATSKTCPRCGKKRKSAPAGRVFSCTNPACRWRGHRDAVGAFNIRAKYRGTFGGSLVVGAVMAAPIGMRYLPHAGVARWEKIGPSRNQVEDSKRAK